MTFFLPENSLVRRVYRDPIACFLKFSQCEGKLIRNHVSVVFFVLYCFFVFLSRQIKCNASLATNSRNNSNTEVLCFWLYNFSSPYWNQSYIRRLKIRQTSHFRWNRCRKYKPDMALVEFGLFLMFTAVPFHALSKNLPESTSTRLENALKSPQDDSTIPKRSLHRRVSMP